MALVGWLGLGFVFLSSYFLLLSLFSSASAFAGASGSFGWLERGYPRFCDCLDFGKDRTGLYCRGTVFALGRCADLHFFLFTGLLDGYEGLRRDECRVREVVYA